jgi:ATP phosphoribosyltransferase
MATSLRVVSPAEVRQLCIKQDAVDPDTLIKTKVIVDDVRVRGDAALMEYATKFGDIQAGQSHIVQKADLKKAFDGLPQEQRDLLERTANRIRSFAEAQLAAIKETQVTVPGGTAGHTISPVECAACYAPGGRYPLPSSVLMTVVTARVAKVEKVYVASPKPSQVTLAAAYVAGAEMLIQVGGAQAIAAMAYGTDTIPMADAVVGPGNKFVTAAKQLVAGRVAIDTLAGPSECLVIADDSADPATVAADLLAQAEHDDDARAILIALNSSIVDKVNAQIAEQLKTLPTAAVAKNALKNSFAVVADSIEAAITLSDLVAPEHLEVHIRDAYQYKNKFRHYGGLFLGNHSAEVLGDYGAGPNHVLPTRGAARASGGLSVFTFLRVRTWLRVDDLAEVREVAKDAVALARIEGLEGHARAAEKRISEEQPAPQPVVPLDRPLPLHVPEDSILQFALPKGRMEEEILGLLGDAGIKITIPQRGYRPAISITGVDVKLLNPRNVTQMLHNGSRDVGFSGSDLVSELDCHLELMLDTGLSPVKIVAAAPEAFLTRDLQLPKIDRPFLIATEYGNLTQKWIKGKGLEARVVLSRGATEVFPPEDADFIVDNTATGSTLKANKLHIIDTLMTSSTGFWANPKALQNPYKRRIIDYMVVMMKAVLVARSNLMLEFHVPGDKLDKMLSLLPAMKRPTLTKLAGEDTYAVKIAAKKDRLADVLHLIKENGGGEIIVTKPVYVVP